MPGETGITLAQISLAGLTCWNLFFTMLLYGYVAENRPAPTETPLHRSYQPSKVEAQA